MMARTNPTVPRQELLYDKPRLADIRDRLAEDGIPPRAIDIKETVDTTAHTYEIRTAIQYWFGGQNDSHRFNNAVWDRCKAIEGGLLVPVDGELAYPDDPRVTI